MRSTRRVRSKRGSTIVIMSVMLFAMLALAAFAIDLASLRSARSEAQRAADAIALAGASAFRSDPWTDPATSEMARVRALDIARVNTVRFDTLNVGDESAPRVAFTYWGGKTGYSVTTPQVTLHILPDSQKVRAYVRHAGVQTFFGGLLGVPYGHVQAKAAAWATDMGPVVNCLKPFVIPDMWYENDKSGEDANDNNYMEPSTSGRGNTQDGESWKFEPAEGDYYIPYDPNSTPPSGQMQTGYGSPARSSSGYPGDVGLPLLIKPQTGNGNGQSAPERMGNAFWLLDFDGNNGNVYDEITGQCATASIGDSVPYLSGGHTGGTMHGIRDLVRLDPSATWNESTKQIEGVDSRYGDWTRSPRVIIIGLISPEYWIADKSNTKPDAGSKFTNFARMFLEDVDGNDNIRGRFLGPAPGGAGGPTGGPLVKILQLIE